MNIACWTGPRNISTALMYAFAARADCAVWDEPYYAAFLAQTGIEHPMRAEIIAAGETDPAKVANRCAAPAPTGEAHFFQKQMAQHLRPGFGREWFSAAIHIFLIRHPARVFASYALKRQHVTLGDLGVVHQKEIYEDVRGKGLKAVVVDSSDLRAQPATMLRALCAAIALSFDPAMLSWPAGGGAHDGVWAPHWYDAVHRTRGFEGAEGAMPELPAEAQPIVEAALPHYDDMRGAALPLQDCASDRS